LPVVLLLLALKAGLHLALVSRYGFHGDELYFIECGRHPAFGYVDHPPLVPWIASLAGLFGDSIVALRLPAIAAGVGTMGLIALFVRDWGGGRFAQLLAGLSFLLAPAFLRMGSMLDIPVIEVLLWTAASYLVSRIITTGRSRLWLAVGVLAGIGLLTKHTMLLWGFGLAVGLLFTSERRQLRSGWLWAGAALALALFLPNLLWQMQNGWATVEFLSGMREGVLAHIPRSLFLAGQVLYMHPLSLPVWLLGLVALLRGDRSRRPFGVMFVAIVAVLLITRGKPYYAAPLYPVLFAAGGVALERLLSRNRLAPLRVGYVALVVAGGVGLGALVVPALPVQRIDAGIEAILGAVVPPMALTHDLHAEFGWDEHVDAVTRAYDSLPPDERARAAILVSSYGQAAAINVLGAERGLPRAVSGHLTYHIWGPPPDGRDVTIVYGMSPEWLGERFGDVRQVDYIDAPLARPFDSALPVFICRAPLMPWQAMWPELKRYSNGGEHPTIRGWASPLHMSPDDTDR